MTSPEDADDESAPEGAEDVARLLAAQPDLAGQPVRLLGEGMDHRAFLAGSTVLRFPRSAEVASGSEREMLLLRLLRPRLPLAVPDLIACAPAEGAPFGFTRHAMLPGRPLSALSVAPAQRTWIASRWGAFCRALHDTPVALAVSLSVPETGYFVPAAVQRRALARLAAIAPRLPRQLARPVEAALRTPPEPGAGEGVLVHSDPWPEHLLADEASHELTGVIDWSDAEIGDPAQDLAGAWFIAGEAGLRACLRSYSAPGDESLAARARYFGLHHAVGDAWHASERGDEAPIARAIAALQGLA